MHIDELELSIRAHRILKREGLTTLDAIADQSESDLLCMEGFGRVSLREVVDVLRDHSRTLRAVPVAAPSKRKLSPLEGRNKAIYEERRDLGTTFRALAAKHGVTTERIRQICWGGDRRAREALLQSDGLSLNGSSGATLETEMDSVEVSLNEALLTLENLTAERDLLKARQKAIHRALMAKEFDGGRPMPPPLPNRGQEQRIAELEREVKKLEVRAEARTRILWMIARAAGGTYTVRALDHSDVGVQGLSVESPSAGVIVITASK